MIVEGMAPLPTMIVKFHAHSLPTIAVEGSAPPLPTMAVENSAPLLPTMSENPGPLTLSLDSTETSTESLTINAESDSFDGVNVSEIPALPLDFVSPPSVLPTEPPFIAIDGTEFKTSKDYKCFVQFPTFCAHLVLGVISSRNICVSKMLIIKLL